MALNVKYLHVTEISDAVKLQMEILPPVLLASRTPPPPPTPNTLNTPITTPNSGSGGQQIAIVGPNSKFDIEGRYWVKPHFLKVLRLVKEVNPTQVVFTYREVNIY